MKNKEGQILIELIVAIGIVIFIGISIAFAIMVSVRSARATLEQTKALFLSRGMVEKVRAFTIEGWHQMDQLATSSANTYFATTSGGKWVHATGTENIILDGFTYTQYFYVDEVFRSTSTGNIVTSGGIWDPSTKKITTQINWTGLNGNGEFSQSFFVSRYTNVIYSQTDWSDGDVGEQVVTEATTTFATSSNVNHASTSGSLKLGEI